MSLGTALPQTDAAALNNLQVLQPVAGHEAHNLWTSLSNTTKPSFLLLNRFDDRGKIKTAAFPVIKPTISSDADSFDARALQGRSVTDPQFSPDGRYLVVKFGEIASPGVFRLYVVDVETGQAKLASSLYLDYYAVTWSPDGNFLAFARSSAPNPRFYDFGRNVGGDLQLFICNWRTGQTLHVASSPSLRGPWAWRSGHNLLFSSLSPQNEKFFHDPRRETGVEFVRGAPVAWERLRGGPKCRPITPGTYEYSVETRSSRLIRRDAFLPVSSPDGKRLAFFSSGDAQRPRVLNEYWSDSPSSTYVAVDPSSNSDEVRYGSARSRRIVLSEHKGAYPTLLWLPDGKLLVLEQMAKSANTKLKIKEWNTNTRRSRLVATLDARDPEAARSPSDPVFQALSLSKDAKHLMILVDEYYSLGHNKGVLNQDTLEDVDLGTGQVTPAGKVRAARGIAWSYETRSP